MSELDDRIKQTLREDDADIFEDGPREPPMFEQAIEVMRGRHRFLVWTSMIYSIIWAGLAVWFAVRFFQAQEVRAMIGWATGFIVALLIIAIVKVWFWMQMDKNTVLREVKRLELQVARLSARLGGGRGD